METLKMINEISKLAERFLQQVQKHDPNINKETFSFSVANGFILFYVECSSKIEYYQQKIIQEYNDNLKPYWKVEKIKKKEYPF